MKRIICTISILLFSTLAFADTLPIWAAKSETHGVKHKSLPTDIPPDSAATRIYIESGSFQKEIPFDEQTDIITLSNQQNGERLYLEHSLENVECTSNNRVIDGQPVRTHPCVDWKKIYLNGKLVEYSIYEATPIPEGQPLYGYNEEHKTFRLTAFYSGQVAFIEDAQGRQKFDEEGNMTLECRPGLRCRKYDEEKQKWGPWRRRYIHLR